ncbi:MAG: HigA family addiction module antidote protein [Desulfovibrio sp.]|jgi:addiction module HigA family antidote|nr:HigA family addiction module antidote protein [Desulfovibrio sp.]
MTSYTTKNQFSPDWVPHPGISIQEVIDDREMTQSELARRMGRTSKFVNELMKGSASLSEETALQLEKVLGVRAGFWLSLERQYKLYKAEEAERESLARQEEWASSFPVAGMVKLGWIPKKREKSGIVKLLLEFFGVASPEAWGEIWGQGKLNVSYRSSQAFSSKATSVAAWLRFGQKIAIQKQIPPFNRNSFRQEIESIRGLAGYTDVKIFVPRLQEICQQCGVIVLFVPKLPGTVLSGAAHWFGGKPIIQLSLCHKSNDHLWFSFFHEMKHILSHSSKEIYINERTNDSPEEIQANKFAMNTLIPEEKYRIFISNWNGNISGIKSFASSVDIAPGIVVGRLQHDKRLPMTIGNELKIRYDWVFGR